MRKTLTAAAALAPLWFAAGHAVAQTTISSGTSTPVATSTTGDLTISSGGSINLSGPGSAVNLNSNSTVTNSGSITGSDLNNVTGIFVTGGNTGSVDNLGAITFTDSTGASSDSTTGDTQSPFAPNHNGVYATTRYGIWEQGGSPFIGSIVNDTGAAISITGNQSYGIFIQGSMVGELTDSGTISMKGDNSVGLYTVGGVTGDVSVQGAITATGTNSSGVVLAGPTSGRFSIYSAITASGYGTDTRSASTTIQTDIQNAPSEVMKGGAAVVVAGNVGGGIYIGAPPAYTTSSSVTDVDGDGIADSAEGTGAIVSYGNQPGMVIGSAGQNVSIGQLQLTSTAYNSNLMGYGLVISGSVSGQGVEDGVGATGLQIGATTANTAVDSNGALVQGVAGGLGALAPTNASGGFASTGATSTGTVNIAGGVYINTGASVSAIAYGADSVGMHILGGSTVPTINVAGALSATTNQPTANTTNGDPTPYTGSSYGLVIEKGASVSNLIVSGVLTATTNGDGVAPQVNNATAVTDFSGSLSNITVSGTVLAYLTPTVTTVTPAGTITAFNLGANTTGVNLLLTQAPELITTAVTTNGTTTTTTSYGAVVQNTTGLTKITTTTSGDTTTTTTVPIAPTVTGDVYIGSGTNVIDLEAGTLQGKLSINAAGAATTTAITLNNSATYTGELIAAANTNFAFNINSGILTDRYPEALQASSLHIGSSGIMSFAIDPAQSLKAATNTSITVSGSAVLDSGAGIGVNVLSTFNGTQTYALITAAGGLTVKGATATLAGDVPYLFYGTTSQNGNTLDLSIREKTPAELGMNQAQGSALPAIYQALSANSAIESGILGQYSKGSFFSLYNQLLPLYSGGLFRAASEAERTISRLTSDPNQIENPTGSRGAWAEQFFVGSNIGRGATLPSQAGGFGYAGGVETGGLGFGAVGATAAFVAINETNPQLASDARNSLSQLELGVYWQGEFRGLTLDTRVAAGYDWFGGRRQFVQFNTPTVVPTAATTALTTATSTTTTTTPSAVVSYNAQTKSNWNGYSLVGHFGAAYEIDLGSVWFVRPQVQADYFRLSQDAYSEGSITPGFNLALKQSVGTESSASALMVLGAKLGRTVVWRPEFELGVRDVFSGDAGVVSGKFIGGTIPFSLNPAEIEGASGVMRFKLKGSSEYYEVGVETGVEVRSRYNEGDAKLSVRVLF